MEDELENIEVNSNFQFETPDFFETDSIPVVPHRHTLEANDDLANVQLPIEEKPTESSVTDRPQITEYSSCLKDVKVYIDTDKNNAGEYRNKLKKLGATVLSRLSKFLTHLVFWAGRQTTLDYVQQLETNVFIVSPHWILKCYEEQKHVIEAPYMLYGISGLAVSVRDIALGRIGSSNKNSSGNSRNSSKMRQKKTVLQRCKGRARALQNTMANEDSDDDSCSHLIYSIEKLSDKLIAKLANASKYQSVDVEHVISPIIHRFKTRCLEHNLTGASGSAIYDADQSSILFNDCNKENADISRENFVTPQGSVNFESSIIILSDTEDEPGEFNHEVSNGASTSHAIPARRSLRVALKRSMEDVADSLRTLSLNTPRRKTLESTTRLIKTEPKKRQSRTTIATHGVSNYATDKFNQHMLRRIGTPRSKQALKMSTQQMVNIYRNLVDNRTSSSSCTSPFSPRARPITVLTKSKILNDLQNVRSSEEFKKCSRSNQRIRDIGNIVVSGYNEDDVEMIGSMIRKLGVLKLSKEVDQQTKYVIGDFEGSITENVMNAVVAGIPIVSMDWVHRSVELGGWLNGLEFLIPKWKKAFKARTNQRSLLFSTLGQIFVSPHCNPNALHITYLIRKSGGQVIGSINRAYVIVSPDANRQTYMSRRLRATGFPVSYVNEQWIIDCIVQNRICPVDTQEISQ